MIFDLLTPPQGPRGWGQNFFYVARPIHVSNSHTKFGWISSNGLGGDSLTDRQQDRIWFWPQYPQVPPLGHDPGDRIKNLSDMFSIFHLWEHTQSLE